MPQITKIPFIGQSYESISKPFAAQQAINFYLEDAQSEARSNKALVGTPGLSTFIDLGAGANAAIRGLHVFEDFLYAVSGQTLYKIDELGNSTALGTIPLTTRVSIENNTTQLCVVNGTDGFIYTPSSDTFEKILDVDFRPADIVQFLDQYFIFHETDSPRFFISALSNGLNYNGLDFGTAEGSPDLIVSILADHRDLLLFGEVSTELWDNTGNVDFPFEVQNGVFIERGCGAPASVVKMDNQVYWLGEDRVIYTLNGYLPAKVSTHAIDERIRQYDRVDDAFAFHYTEGGHFFYCITFPDGDETWCYDASSKSWHQRSSGAKAGRWRANAYAKFKGKNYIGDSQSGKIFEMSLETYAEDGNPIVRVRTTMPETANELPVFMAKLQVYMESGAGLVSGQGSNPLVGLSWSDDGGRTFKDPRFREMGKTGEYATRVIWRRLGRFRNRIFKLVVTDPIKTVIIDASAEVEPGF